jgi:MYXO-CTERM domain-containing protein
VLLENARTMTQKKLAAAALAGLLSAGALTAAGEAAQAQTQGDGGEEVVNREVQVREDRDYTGLWGLLGLAGLAGLAGLRRKRDGGAEVRRVPSADDDARRGTVRDSEVVGSTEGRTGCVRDGDKVRVDRDGSGDTHVRRAPSGR